MNLSPIAALIALITASTTLQAEGSSLTLRVDGIRPGQGNLRIQLFDSEANWLKHAILSLEGDTSEATYECVIPDLPAGTYGIFVHQDMDGDGELDKNMMGMPTEPYAFSNDARGMFGPAKWNKASITITADQEATSITFPE